MPNHFLLGKLTRSGQSSWEGSWVHGQVKMPAIKNHERECEHDHERECECDHERECERDHGCECERDHEHECERDHGRECERDHEHESETKLGTWMQIVNIMIHIINTYWYIIWTGENVNQEHESERERDGHSRPPYHCARAHGSALLHLCSHSAALYQSLTMLVAELWQWQLWGCRPLWTLLLSFVTSTRASIPVTQVFLHNLLMAMASTSISVSISGFNTSQDTVVCLMSQTMAHETAGLWPGELTGHVAQRNVNCSIESSITRALSSPPNEISEQVNSVYW